MPPKIMQYDYNRPKSAHPIKIFQSSTNKRQLSVSASRFRFHKFKNVPLGVIHPEQFSNQTANEKKATYRLEGPPEYKNYRPGDREFMELTGKSMKLTNVVPNIVYSAQDKAQLPEHLTNPFIYVQQTFERGRTPEQTALNHPDIFIHFENLAESFRDNLNIKNQDYVKILKGMNKEDRKEFYRKCIQMNSQFFEFFKLFVGGLRSKGILEKKLKQSHKTQKLPRQQIMNLAYEQGFLVQGEQISLINFTQLVSELGFPPQSLESQVKQFFTNVLLGDSPINLLIQNKKQQQTISLKAFLYNIQRFLIDKHKIKNIFSKNAAKQRNIEIKASVLPYLGDTWRGFKRILNLLRAKEEQTIGQLKIRQEFDLVEKLLSSISDRQKLITTKRIYSKHLQADSLKYLLLSVDDIKSTYLSDIQQGSRQLQIFKDFIIVFFQNLDGDSFTLEEAVDFMVYSQYSQSIASQIILLIKKILKYFGQRVQTQHSRFATTPVMDAQIEVTKNQVGDFIRMYTEKKMFEQLEFKELVDQLREFRYEALKNIKLNHQEPFEQNMVAEWLVRKLKKLDKKILMSIQYSLELMGTEHSEHKVTYQSFLSEKMINFLQLSNTDSQQSNKKMVKDEIAMALRAYQMVAQELNETTKYIIKPIQVEILTAKQLIDQDVIPVEKKQAQIEGSIGIQNEQPEVLKKQVTQFAQPKIIPRPVTTMQPNLYEEAITRPSLSDHDLDNMIRNALILQGKCESTLSDIKFKM